MIRYPVILWFYGGSFQEGMNYGPFNLCVIFFLRLKPSSTTTVSAKHCATAPHERKYNKANTTLVALV